jgi:hypothetical protein
VRSVETPIELYAFFFFIVPLYRCCYSFNPVSSFVKKKTIAFQKKNIGIDFSTGVGSDNFLLVTEKVEIVSFFSFFCIPTVTRS